MNERRGCECGGELKEQREQKLCPIIEQCTCELSGCRGEEGLLGWSCRSASSFLISCLCVPSLASSFVLITFLLSVGAYWLSGDAQNTDRWVTNNASRTLSCEKLVSNTWLRKSAPIRANTRYCSQVIRGQKREYAHQ